MCDFMKFIADFICVYYDMKLEIHIFKAGELMYKRLEIGYLFFFRLFFKLVSSPYCKLFTKLIEIVTVITVLPFTC